MRKSGLRAFPLINAGLLILLALVCVFPLIHVLALSFSSSTSAAVVTLFPVRFTLASYTYVLSRMDFWRSMVISLERVALGVSLNMLLTVLCAYPLSKEQKDFRRRNLYVWVLFFTAVFGGGLIPTYMLIMRMGLLDSLFSLVLPGAVPVFNVLVLLNFFRQLPPSLEEAACIDGASHWQVLWRIFIPISLPALATLTLFSAVGHWNSWFDGIIFMNRPENYPLQSFLRTIIMMPSVSDMSIEKAKELQSISARTTKSAQIFIAMVPILLFYPFLQRYFVKGLVLGSVKE